MLDKFVYFFICILVRLEYMGEVNLIVIVFYFFNMEYCNNLKD